MMGFAYLRLTAALALAAFVAGNPVTPTRAEEKADGRPVRIGLVKTLLRDTPEAMVPTVLHTFKTLITSQTGLEGQLSVAGTPDQLGRDLTDGKLQLGVFHGFEFAWARQSCPKLKPLVVAINHSERLHAYLIVNKASEAGRLADLQGKTLALPLHTREHCRLYLERECLKCGLTLPGFFGTVCKPRNGEEALDLVATGRVAVTVVDSCFLDWYREQKAARFAQLKKLDQSESFPAAVLVYNPETVDPAILDRLREGLLNASKNPRGQNIMSFCQITHFEAPSQDFNQLLTDIARSYPATAETKGR
jgi:ABC-type phosphate/phosphonate transport system substrate-binding protein